MLCCFDVGTHSPPYPFPSLPSRPYAAPTVQGNARLTVASLADREEKKRLAGAEDYAERTAYLQTRATQRNARLVRQGREREEMKAEKARRAFVRRSKTEYRRQMLSTMRKEVLRTPISDGGDGGGRIGGNLLLPLYQSERLVACMEREVRPAHATCATCARATCTPLLSHSFLLFSSSPPSSAPPS